MPDRFKIPPTPASRSRGVWYVIEDGKLPDDECVRALLHKRTLCWL